jgi:hypothetical protein
MLKSLLTESELSLIIVDQCLHFILLVYFDFSDSIGFVSRRDPAQALASFITPTFSKFIFDYIKLKILTKFFYIVFLEISSGQY